MLDRSGRTVESARSPPTSRPSTGLEDRRRHPASWRCSGYSSKHCADPRGETLPFGESAVGQDLDGLGGVDEGGFVTAVRHPHTVQ